MKFFEVNFDGIVGPTHNYAGLSLGNVASMKNEGQVSHPRAAALQGLAKMKGLMELGIPQGVLPPQHRPITSVLRQLGFSGSDSSIIRQASQQAPELLSACSSASSMWTANAATVSPSADTNDGRVHFTPANLVNQFHRSLEPPQTAKTLQAIFSDESHFCHHSPLPSHPHFSDEGAANHTRLCTDHSQKGLEIFVFGKSQNQSLPSPQKFPGRQTLEASQAIARSHLLDPKNTIFTQQNPDVIDQGVFHNDVIAVGYLDCLFFHEQAFLNKDRLLKNIGEWFNGQETHLIEVPTSKVPVKDAVESYLFNSQLIQNSKGAMALIVPQECQTNEKVWSYLNELTSGPGPIQNIHVFDVKQSMQNGGGPACLRLRVALSEAELEAVNSSCLLNETLYGQLQKWIGENYRENLSPSDLGDPQLLEESKKALDELTQILQLGSLYPFQS